MFYRQIPCLDVCPCISVSLGCLLFDRMPFPTGLLVFYFVNGNQPHNRNRILRMANSLTNIVYNYFQNIKISQRFSVGFTNGFLEDSPKISVITKHGVSLAIWNARFGVARQIRRYLFFFNFLRFAVFSGPYTHNNNAQYRIIGTCRGDIAQLLILSVQLDSSDHGEAQRRPLRIYYRTIAIISSTPRFTDSQKYWI